MTSRPYDTADYPTICTWWAAHKTNAVPEFYLPRDGIVATHQSGALVSAAWLYHAEHAQITWLAWLVSSPFVSPYAAAKGLQTVLTAAEGACRARGRGIMFVEAPRDSLVDFYKKNGYIVNHPTVHLNKLL